ncbi:hypothetical protein BY996DRAFT_6410154 [Phakopsora pachyrhizi]|uniref:Signal recognition particle subunit SRP14 n=1 Tax=Phakopsora pachyrhizi TaxID=170000 RepID=A0AAV0ALP2_PHAPC|nr:hypothetical protein BY996DRAFT_6410154 [Phakopsora pachyrhizi]CAH7667939.1 hypothetical protein PPACK8108_LOCUS2381 [Phakopsora pachyrhizi]
MLVENDEFLKKLEEVLSVNQSINRTCFITQKRFNFNGEGDVSMVKISEEDFKFSCLFRLTDGSKSFKYSTLVYPDRSIRFENSYSSILKLNLLRSLRPKKKKRSQRSNQSKQQQSQSSSSIDPLNLSLKKILPKVVGPKRGPGVKKRRGLVLKRSRLLFKIRNKQASSKNLFLK